MPLNTSVCECSVYATIGHGSIQIDVFRELAGADARLREVPDGRDPVMHVKRILLSALIRLAIRDVCNGRLGM